MLVLVGLAMLAHGMLPGVWAQGSGGALLLELEGPIGPAAYDYLHRGLERAEEAGAELVILRMDTPGGLDTSMRKIIRNILASPVPVVTFVAPSGARAASAGTYILYASHVAAMAPGTNLGAATPVQLGGGAPGQPPEPEDGEAAPDGGGTAMEKKIVNDAVAYIRSLAQLRGRNEQWAERAVRQGASLPAEEAVEENVAELTASDVGDLLAKLDGRQVSVLGRTVTLQTEGMAVERVEPDWRTRFLAVITDPNVAYVLMLLGIYGLIFEFANPGMVIPGVVGTICLVVALFAFQVIPINYAGLGLMLVGIGFMVAEVFVPSFGALGIGGAVAFVVGSIMLVDTRAPGFGLSLPLVLTFAVVNAVLFLAVLGLALKARHRPVVSGREEMIGAHGRAVESFQGHGSIRVHGEVWSAESAQALVAGQAVVVTGMDGLVLNVVPAEDSALAPPPPHPG